MKYAGKDASKTCASYLCGVALRFFCGGKLASLFVVKVTGFTEGSVACVNKPGYIRSKRQQFQGFAPGNETEYLIREQYQVDLNDDESAESRNVLQGQHQSQTHEMPALSGLSAEGLLFVSDCREEVAHSA